MGSSTPVADGVAGRAVPVPVGSTGGGLAAGVPVGSDAGGGVPTTTRGAVGEPDGRVAVAAPGVLVASSSSDAS
jgi:hypothetical protein